jgi:hypothetical protein
LSVESLSRCLAICYLRRERYIQQSNNTHCAISYVNKVERESMGIVLVIKSSLYLLLLLLAHSQLKRNGKITLQKILKTADFITCMHEEIIKKILLIYVWDFVEIDWEYKLLWIVGHKTKYTQLNSTYRANSERLVASELIQSKISNIPQSSPCNNNF